jgi:MraZ protein
MGGRPPSEGTVDQFLGEYEHSLDAKGRLILPAKFRAPLEEGAVLSIGQERCLAVYPRDVWKQMSSAANAKTRDDDEGRAGKARAMARTLFALAQPVTPDGQGRIAISDGLREHAGLDKKVVVTGALDRIEIWDEARWAEEKARGESMLAGGPLPGVGA